MLPEKALRMVLIGRIELEWPVLFTDRMAAVKEQVFNYCEVHSHKFLAAGKNPRSNPQTLTGDVWRAAWAKRVQDAASAS